MIVVGVDGCKKGWIAAAWNTRKQELDLSVHTTFAEVLTNFPHAKAIGVDIPIGLIECGRAADREARALLRCRKSSVFPSPDPRVVELLDYHTANDMMKELCGSGVPAQAFGIYRKVAEVNELVTPELQARLFEVHPEVCFWAMNGGMDICEPKRTPRGYATRLELLKRQLSLTDVNWATIENGCRGAQADDVLDAIAAAWTARRWVNHSFGRVPLESETDARGRRAEIVF